jgi:hypothetical protein
MTKNSRFVSAAIALASLASVSFATVPAQAAVICKGGIVMRGCIAATKPMIITPAAPVATTTVTHAAYVAPAPAAAPAPATTTTVASAAYVAPAPVATTTVARAAYIKPAPVAVTHAGVTRVTPNGVAHAGVTRVWR